MSKIADLLKASALMSAAAFVFAGAAHAETTIDAVSVGLPMTLDGNVADWNGIAGVTVPLTKVGRAKGGHVAQVEVKAAVHGDMIYMLAVWDDSTESMLHKPYRWDEAKQAYKATKEGEDRFAISLPCPVNSPPTSSTAASSRLMSGTGSRRARTRPDWLMTRAGQSRGPNSRRAASSAAPTARDPDSRSKKLKNPVGLA